MKIRVPLRETNTSIEFPDGGYQLLKNKRLCACIPIIPENLSKKTGHIHLDAGSVTLSVDGYPLLVDPGTYTYTRDFEKRIHYLGFQSHNGPVVKNSRIYGVTIPGFFNVELENRFSITGRTDYSITYEHTYYGEKVSRSVMLHTNGIVITDSAQRPIVSTFHFSPRVTEPDTKSENRYVFHTETGAVNFSTNGNTRTGRYEYSDGYGCTEPAIKIEVESVGYNKVELSF